MIPVHRAGSNTLLLDKVPDLLMPHKASKLHEVPRATTYMPGRLKRDAMGKERTLGMH